MLPNEMDFRMPPEWEPHSRTFISWPVQDSLCHQENYAEVCAGYEEIIKAIAEFEPVTVIINAQDEGEMLRRFDKHERINWLQIEHNDGWIRDNGPTFLTNKSGKLAGVNWSFNAWGGKYVPWDLDDQVAPQILESLGIKTFSAPLIMEGGSFHVDGEGTLITTEECLLNGNRNPELSKEQIENFLKIYLGIEKVIWLKRGLSGDETDGHVDNEACFGAPGVVLLQVCDDPEDENYLICQENQKILQAAVDAKGRTLKVIPLQQPLARYEEGQRLTLSYLNFYFVNGGIILPVFGGSAAVRDEQAVKILSSVFPERRIHTVDGMGIVREGGNVHCITQQMPQGKKELE